MQLEFHGLQVLVQSISGEGAERSVIFEAGPPESRERVELDAGGFAVVGDVLLSLGIDPPRRGSANPEPSLTLYHVPSMAPRDSGDGNVSFSQVRPGEFRFFKGGFLLLREISENDPMLTDDDSALLVAQASGEPVEMRLREFHSSPVGEVRLFTANVFGGDTPDQASADFELLRDGSLLPGAGEPVAVAVPAAQPTSALDLELSAEPMESAVQGSRIWLTARHGDDVLETMLSPAEAVRWGSWGLAYAGEEDGASKLLACRFAGEAAPMDARLPGGAAPAPSGQSSDARNQPNEIQRRLLVGEAYEFHGARIELLRTYVNQPERLSDDDAEFRIVYGGLVEIKVIREGRRESFGADNRWWVLEAREVTPSPNPENSKAEIYIRTGIFTGKGEYDSGRR